MGRSAEAIARRAKARGRTEQEQVSADRLSERKQLAKKRKMKAIGDNMAEKRKRRRPANMMMKKKMEWSASPASSETIERNQALREAYAKNPDAMSPDDRNRAKILVERSERKKMKKMKRARRKSLGNKKLIKKQASPPPLPSKNTSKQPQEKKSKEERTEEEKKLDWVCDKCGNNNWGRRLHCNTSACKRARSDVMTGDDCEANKKKKKKKKKKE